MTGLADALLALLPLYGVWLIAAVTFLSCLAVPIPTSLVMLVAGGFSASGDMHLASVVMMALAGAILGDQVGFRLGRIGGGALLLRLRAAPSRAVFVDRASTLVSKRGGTGVFLSRWLVSPLGPWLNFVAGAANMGWLRFTLCAVAGEAVWVVIYVGLGYGFAGNILELSSLLGSASALLAGVAVLVALGLWLRRSLRLPAAEN
ncbi:MAG: DedA family protein [Gemmobacter sp.]